MMQRFLCWFGFHGTMATDKTALRWVRRYCVDCRRVVLVRDAFTSCNYSNAYQISDEYWATFPNPSDAAWVFTLGASAGLKEGSEHG